MFEIAREMYIDGKALGNKSTRDKFLLKLLKTLDIIARSLKESEKKHFYPPILTNFAIE